jgi:hypothetical protein
MTDKIIFNATNYPQFSRGAEVYGRRLQVPRLLASSFGLCSDPNCRHGPRPKNGFFPNGLHMLSGNNAFFPVFWGQFVLNGGSWRPALGVKNRQQQVMGNNLIKNKMTSLDG